MKKIFTLFALAAMAFTASAQDNKYEAPGENIAANTVLVDNSLLSVKTVFASTGSEEAQTICGESFVGWFQLRVNADPTADVVTGTETSGSTPLVVEAKSAIDFSIYTRRQKGSNGYVAGDNKGILAVNQEDISAVESAMVLTDGSDEEGAYAYVKDTFHFNPGTYTIYRRGSTMRVFGFTWAESVATGIADIAVDENAPVEYFNLQGIRVENPANGLFIRRQGNKVEKILVK